jgi:ureidoglycolate lyase
MISIEQLTADKFSAFGNVIEYDNPHDAVFLDDDADIVRDVAGIETLLEKGRAQLDILRLSPRAMPFSIVGLSRNPTSTTTFLPVLFYPFIMIVSDSTGKPDSRKLRAYMTNGQQGVNLKARIWYHRPVAVKRRIKVLQLGGDAEQDDIETAAFDVHVMVGV